MAKYCIEDVHELNGCCQPFSGSVTISLEACPLSMLRDMGLLNFCYLANSNSTRTYILLYVLQHKHHYHGISICVLYLQQPSFYLFQCDIVCACMYTYNHMAIAIKQIYITEMRMCKH